MPGSTMHIIFARTVRPQGSTAYYTGSVALDAIDNYEIKNKNHFRHTDNKIEKIAEFIRNCDKNDFNDGLATHLYLDWRWDMCEVERFAQLRGGNWFHDYRTELSKIGHYYAHNADGVQKIWDDIYNQPISEYGNVPLATSNDLRLFIETAYESQKQIKKYPKLFKPDEVDLFLQMTAMEYSHFLSDYVYK